MGSVLLDLLFSHIHGNLEEDEALSFVCAVAVLSRNKFRFKKGVKKATHLGQRGGFEGRNKKFNISKKRDKN